MKIMVVLTKTMITTVTSSQMQLRAEEDSARKIGGGADGDDGGRGDKEGLNLKVAHYVNHVSQMNKRFVENVKYIKETNLPSLDARSEASPELGLPAPLHGGGEN